MKYSFGFSLFELMLTLVIIIILSISITPHYLQFVNKNQQHLKAMQLLRAIELTRSEAIARGKKITLMPLNHWQEGYLIREDENDLYSFELNLKGILLFKSRSQKNLIQFGASGFTHSDNGTFYYCADKSVKPVWAIILNTYSRARFVEPNHRGDIRDHAGKLILC